MWLLKVRAESAQRGPTDLHLTSNTLATLFWQCKDFGLRVISNALTRRIVPTTNLSLSFEVNTDMYYDLRRPVREAAKTDEWKTSKPLALARAVKQAFDDTCTEWEERLDARLFNGHPAGTFRQCCSLFEAPVEEFDTLLEETKGFYPKVAGVPPGEERIYAALVWMQSACIMTPSRLVFGAGWAFLRLQF